MSDFLQVATQKPITNFVNNNIVDDVEGEIVTFKYGGIYYTRILIPEKEDEEDNLSRVYGVLLKHIRNQILKAWIFDREDCRHLTHSIRKPFYRDEMGQTTIAA